MFYFRAVGLVLLGFLGRLNTLLIAYNPNIPTSLDFNVSIAEINAAYSTRATMVTVLPSSFAVTAYMCVESSNLGANFQLVINHSQ